MFVQTFVTGLIFVNLNIATCWDFEPIKETMQALDCIHVNIRNAEHDTLKSLYKLLIPLERSTGVGDVFALKSNCRHIMWEINKTQELYGANKNVTYRSGYVFQLYRTLPNWQDVLATAAKNWESHRIHKVFYMTQEGTTHFYHPFLMGKNGQFGLLVDAKDYNINAMFRNLHEYPMRVYVFDSVFANVEMADVDTKKVTQINGADARAAYLLEEMLNFKLDLQWPDDEFFGARLQNGSYNGALGRMIRDKTDITMTGFFVKDYLTRDIEFSPSVYMDKLCCYVIKAKRIPPSILPLYAVHESIWTVYVTVGILSSFLWMLLRRANLRWNSNPDEIIELKKKGFNSFEIFTDTWVLWVRMSMLRFPPSNAERIFIISLCLVSVIIGAIVESSLATVYITPRYYKDINTLEELEKANLTIFYKHAAIKNDLFAGHSSRIYQALDKKMMLVGEPEERLISIMAKRGGYVAVTRSYSLQLVDIYYFTTKKVFLIPECPRLYHIAYVLGKDSPYREVVNGGLLQFLAAGLINHWIDETRFKAKSRIHLFREYVAETDSKWKVFNIVDLQLAFYVLICGIILSSLIFLIEFVYNLYVMKKNKSRIM